MKSSFAAISGVYQDYRQQAQLLGKHEHTTYAPKSMQRMFTMFLQQVLDEWWGCMQTHAHETLSAAFLQQI